MGVVTMVPLRWIERYSWTSHLFALAILIVVLFVGREINGSIRWIPLGSLITSLRSGKAMCGGVHRRLSSTSFRTVRNHWSGFAFR